MGQGQTTNGAADKEGAGGLQWLREIMAVLISLVILVMSAVMMWRTFEAAERTVDPRLAAPDMQTAKQLQLEAYSRQKDILLYVLALFGTVTGYYLGRVPAELNARRAENAATSAQKELTSTHEKLSDAAASASVASAQLAQAKEEKSRVSAHLKESTRALRDVRSTLMQVSGESTPAGRSSLAGVKTGPEVAVDPLLRQAQERIDAALAQIEEHSFS
jgi:hypothetical protein